MQYKNIVAGIFGLLLLAPFHQAVASIFWCDPLLGFCSNPYGNVSTNPPANLDLSGYAAQQQQAVAQDQVLEQQYGITAYNACSAQTKLSSCESGVTPSLCPMALKTCLLQYEVAQAQLCTIHGGSWSGGQTSAGKCQCSSGYFLQNGACVSGDQGCVDNYGAHSVMVSTTAQGKAQCGCALGYQWDNSGNQCVATTPTCTANSTYNGSQCICNAGYSSLSGYCISNQAASQALHPTAVTTPTKTTGSHLAANQIAAILSLLQAFGADQSVIASVQVALGQ